MKLTDFIDDIASLDCDWRLDQPEGAITDRGNDCCPIWAMYYDLRDGGAEDVFEAGRQIGLTTRQVSRFISAADSEGTPYKGLREKLLAATVDKPRSGL